MALYELLHRLNIPYQEVSHAAVYTIGGGAASD